MRPTRTKKKAAGVYTPASVLILFTCSSVILVFAYINRSSICWFVNNLYVLWIPRSRSSMSILSFDINLAVLIVVLIKYIVVPPDVRAGEALHDGVYTGLQGFLCRCLSSHRLRDGLAVTGHSRIPHTCRYCVVRSVVPGNARHVY